MNISVAVGDKIRGGAGSLCAALGTIMPSFLIILTIAVVSDAGSDTEQSGVEQGVHGDASGGGSSDHSSGDYQRAVGEDFVAHGVDTCGGCSADMVGVACGVKPDSVCGAWRCGRLSVVWPQRRQKGEERE